MRKKLKMKFNMFQITLRKTHQDISKAQDTEMIIKNNFKRYQI